MRSDIWWIVREWLYEKVHRLQDFGGLGKTGTGRYRGETLTFLDGTVIHDRDKVGNIHLKNPYLSTFHTQSAFPGLRFGDEAEDSLRLLAQVTRENPRYRAIKAWRGMTWSTRGFERFCKRLGFEPRPIEDEKQREHLRTEFETILQHFGGDRTPRNITPMTFWMTGSELLRRYGPEGASARGEAGNDQDSCK